MAINCLVPTWVIKSPTLKPANAPGPAGLSCVTIIPLGSLLALTALRMSIVVSATPNPNAGTQLSWPPEAAESSAGSGERATLMAEDCSVASRAILIVARESGANRAVMVLNILNVAGAKLMLNNTSPMASDCVDGPCGSSPVITAWPEALTRNAVATSGVNSCAEIPRYPRSTRPCASSCPITADTDSPGIAEPKPTEPPLGEKMTEVTPTTLPVVDRSGPTELPRLIAASVCRKLM